MGLCNPWMIRGNGDVSPGLTKHSKDSKGHSSGSSTVWVIWQSISLVLSVMIHSGVNARDTVCFDIFGTWIMRELCLRAHQACLRVSNCVLRH